MQNEEFFNVTPELVELSERCAAPDTGTVFLGVYIRECVDASCDHQYTGNDIPDASGSHSLWYWSSRLPGRILQFQKSFRACDPNDSRDTDRYSFHRIRTVWYAVF